MTQIIQTSPGDFNSSLPRQMPGRAEHESVKSAGSLSIRQMLVRWLLLVLVQLVAMNIRGLAQSQMPGAGKTLTLPEAVSIALKQNPTLRAAGDYAEAVRHGIAVA